MPIQNIIIIRYIISNILKPNSVLQTQTHSILKWDVLWRHPITYINSMNHNLPTHIDVSGGRNLAKCNEVR